MRAVTPYSDPIAGPVPRSAAARALWRLKHRVRSLLGVRRGFKVEGVYYKETSTVLLARALSRKGAGEKEFRVTFPDSSKLLIHASPRRPYADLMGPTLLPHFQVASGMVRPGMRILTAPGGTGSTARWLAERVGPSGAVVALDSDEESVTYAQRRYPLPNVAFERGARDALVGEINGSFDAAFVVTTDPAGPPPALFAEVWRVVAPGGWILAGCPADLARAAIEERIRALAPVPAGASAAPGEEPILDWSSTLDAAFHVVIVRKLGT